MNDQVLRTQTDRRQLQQIIAGLTEGVILIEPDQRILWANEAALAMHGVDSLQGLGADTGEYRERFRLRYRNNHPLQEGQYPVRAPGGWRVLQRRGGGSVSRRRRGHPLGAPRARVGADHPRGQARLPGADPP